MSGTIVDSLMAGVAGATTAAPVNGVLPTSAQVTANRTKTLRVVLGSDVSTMNGFSGSQGKLGGDGFNMAHNVFDSLFIVGYDKSVTVAANGGNNTWLPNLLTSATPSANNTVWTCTVRTGVTFSNGKPFTAANIVVAMTAAFADTTVGFAINPLLNSVTMTDSHTVVYTTALPWATFPIVLANSQIGFIAYPSTFMGDVVSAHATLIKSELDSGSFTTQGINAINALCPNGLASGGWSPSANSKVLGGGATGAYPIGTGPFTLSSGDWTNNAGATFRRNANYWKVDANGNRLPYVGTLTTKIQPDTGQQYGYLTAKSADVIYNTDGNYMSKMATAYKSNFVVDDTAPYSHTVSCLMFNTLGESFFAGGKANWGATGVAGVLDGHDAGSAAVKDVRIRKAVAMAINLKTFNSTVNKGAYPWGGTSANAIDGVFNPKSPYYPTGGTGYPKYSTTGAKALVAAWKKDNGNKTPTFTINAIQGSSQQKTAFNLIKAACSAVGITVNANYIDNATLINDAIYKTYDCTFWSQFGLVSPSELFVWMMNLKAVSVKGNGDSAANCVDSSGHAFPAAQYDTAGFVNFAQHINGTGMNYLVTGLANNQGSAAERSAFQNLDKVLAADVPYVYLGTNTSAFASQTNVRNFAYATAGDGTTKALYPNETVNKFSETFLV